MGLASLCFPGVRDLGVHGRGEPCELAGDSRGRRGGADRCPAAARGPDVAPPSPGPCASPAEPGSRCAPSPSHSCAGAGGRRRRESGRAARGAPPPAPLGTWRPAATGAAAAPRTSWRSGRRSARRCARSRTPRARVRAAAAASIRPLSPLRDCPQPRSPGPPSSTTAPRARPHLLSPGPPP